MGAGAARACGLPDIAQLQGRVLNRLRQEEREPFSNQLQGRNLEEALSRLRRIAALLTGDQAVDGLTATQAAALDAAVCQAIVNELDIEAADITPACLFAAWAARAGYRLPLELFTVNYDLLLETALEIACEMVERFPESAALKSKLVSAIAQYGLVIRGSYADHEFGIAAAIEGARDALGGKYPHERSWLDDLARKFREAAKRTKRQEDDEWTED